MTIGFTLNNHAVNAQSSDGDMPLLWFLRESQGLKGTKFGCGIGQCGACTVHINGKAAKACSVTLAQVAGSEITTIEGLADGPDTLHPVQQAWMDTDVPQCGYCQAGQIMAAAALLSEIPDPTDTQISQHMTNLCRCATYVRIRKAIHLAADKLATDVG